MKTDELIAMLAGGGAAVDRAALKRRYVTAVGWGAFGATLLMAIALGVRPDLIEATRLPMFWVKLAFPAALAAAALLAVSRLARPGAQTGRAAWALAAPVLFMWMLAAAVLFSADPAVRDELIFGDTWQACLVNITFLSLPALAAIVWAVKGHAPTRPVLTGATAGLFSGALGAFIYALHCPELAAPFIGIWYVLGMLIPAALGAAIGARLLRW